MTPCWVCGQDLAGVHLDVRDADRGEQACRLDLCAGCRSGRLAEFPSDEVLAAYYDESYYGRGDSKFAAPLQAIVNLSVRARARRIMRSLGAVAAPRILDIGCGRGALLEQLARRGARATGLERAAPVAVPAGVDIRAGDLQDQGFAAASLDAVVLWHVFEHLRDPRAVLREIGRILKPGGLLLIAVPNNASWQARTFGAGWFHVDAPRHLHFFGHQGLTAMLQREGYRITASSTSDAVQNLFGFIQSSLNRIPGSPPNRLYRLMRSASSPRAIAELLLWAVPATLLLLPALLEFGLSAWRERGGCSIVYSRLAAP